MMIAIKKDKNINDNSIIDRPNIPFLKTSKKYSLNKIVVYIAILIFI